MKHFNTLVRILMYQYKNMEATHVASDGIFYKVPHIPQQHMNLCTDAAMNMLYKIGNKPVASMSKNPHALFEGRSYKNLPEHDFIRSHIILKAEREPSDKQYQRIQEELSQILKINGPFILDISLRLGGHSVVVTGISNNNIIFNDPLVGANKALPIEQLCAQLEKKSERFIELIKPDFLTQEHLAAITSNKLPKQVDVITDTKHKHHFTLHKMEHPCEALRAFLWDTIKKDKCSVQEKEKLSGFLEKYAKATNISDLMHQLDKILSSSALSAKLTQRLQSAAHYMNVPKEANEGLTQNIPLNTAVVMKEHLSQMKAHETGVPVFDSEASNIKI